MAGQNGGPFSSGGNIEYLFRNSLTLNNNQSLISKHQYYYYFYNDGGSLSAVAIQGYKGKNGRCREAADSAGAMPEVFVVQRNGQSG